ncbi:hypothetical protein H0H92_012343 [Tricholoma furcatifolium]|nr:hypothetical protein H0H92_012343 [Tricholoma furcatifolium]
MPSNTPIPSRASSEKPNDASNVPKSQNNVPPQAPEVLEDPGHSSAQTSVPVLPASPTAPFFLRFLERLRGDIFEALEWLQQNHLERLF